MSGPTRGAPNSRVLFVEAETTFGTPVTQYPLAVSALRIISSSVTAKSPRQARDDAFGTASQIGSIALKSTTEWTFECELYTPGTASTDPDWHDVMVNLLGMQQQAAVANTAVSGASSTATTVDVTNGDGANFTALKSHITVNGETRRVTVIDVSGDPDILTVSPPLSAAPSAADVVYSAPSYHPKDASDVTPAGATLWFADNANMWRVTGAVATSWSIAGGGNGSIRLTVSGTAQESRLLFTGTWPAGGNNSVTTMVVSNAGLVPDDVSAANPYYLTLSAGLATEESVRVTAKAGTSYTIVRGSPSGSGQTHAAGCTVEPYQPTGTYAGSPIPATGGMCYMASELTRIETFTLDVDPGIIPRENVHGAAYTFFDYVLGRRTVTNSAEAWSENASHMLRVFDAKARTATEFFEQQGDTTGSIVAITTPNTYVEVPDFSYDDSDQRLTFSGEAVGLLGEDELFIASG